MLRRDARQGVASQIQFVDAGKQLRMQIQILQQYRFAIQAGQPREGKGLPAAKGIVWCIHDLLQPDCFANAGIGHQAFFMKCRLGAIQGKQVDFLRRFADKGARTAPATQQTLAHQRVEGLPYCWSPDAVHGDQLVFRRDAGARREFAGANLCAEPFGQLVIQGYGGFGVEHGVVSPLNSVYLRSRLLGCQDKLSGKIVVGEILIPF